MRIVSLLPSLTELVHALGKGGDLVGVTHECDYPSGVENLPHLTRSRIPSSASSAEIDALVSGERGSLYELNTDVLDQLRPELILTQEQCDVCAVNEATVRDVTSTMTGWPHVESVNPTDLEGLFAMFRRIGELLGARDAANRLIERFRETTALITQRLEVNQPPRRRALLLEWFDPPYASGHWNPELISLAGGIEPIARPGERSRRLDWSEIASAAPEVILLAPCGFTLDRTAEELPHLVSNAIWQSLPAVRNGSVAIADGSAYFSRPGPRLEESLRIAAAVLNPELFLDLAPHTGWRFLGQSDG